MGILEFLGLKDDEPAHKVADTAVVARMMETLDSMEPERARFVACFGAVLGRVANADLNVVEEELAGMERLVHELGHVDADDAAVAVRIATERALSHGATEGYLVTREFTSIASVEERRQLLDACYAVASADGTVTAEEEHEIRQISSELGLTHKDFVAARRRYKDYLGSLQD